MRDVLLVTHKPHLPRIKAIMHDHPCHGDLVGELPLLNPLLLVVLVCGNGMGVMVVWASAKGWTGDAPSPHTSSLTRRQ